MLYLEAQSVGLPCLAENRPGPADVVHGMELPPPGDPAAFAAAISAAAADRAALVRAGRTARVEVARRHSLAAAAGILRDGLMPLLADA